MGWWEDLNEGIKKNINKPVNDWLASQVGGGGVRMGTYGPQKQAIAPSSTPGPKVGFDIGAGSGRVSSSYVPPQYSNVGNGTRQGNDDIPESTYRDGPAAPSLLEQLISGISEQYQPQQRPGMQDQINQFKATLDNALAQKLAGYGGIRNTAQENYNTSDRNLMEMFGANAANIAQQGSAAYSKITADQKAGLNQTRDESINTLQADRSKQIAERQAMLQALGIQGVGESADPTVDTLSKGIETITNRSNINSNMADQMGANNQAFNQSVVNSVNQQGTERRAALMQQLQSIFGKLDMAEADARSQTEQAKAQGELQMQQAMASAPDNSYDIFRDRQNNMMDLYKTLTGQQLEREKMMQSGDPSQQKVQGFSGLAQDLLNSGVDPNSASQYIGVLSNVLGSEYMKGVNPDEGYDRASIIARRLMANGVPPVVAGQLATNYANLGNNASFSAQ